MNSPQEILGKHISRLVPAVTNRMEDIFTFFETKTVAKNELLVEQDHSSPDCLYFVTKGLLDLYFTDHCGHHTIHFAMENWWIAEYPSLTSDNKAAFSISALEDSVLISIHKSRYEALLLAYPLLAVYFNIIHQRAYAASLMKQKVFATVSSKDFHQFFFTTYPEFVRRVPDEIMASYMHISVEELKILNANFFLKPA